MKTLSLTNLDRITKLDFNLSSNTNAVGGRLSISKFKNLEVLKATYNDLTKFTFSTSNNVTLKELDLSNNLLTTISDIKSLVNLETLDLSNNLLTTISDIGSLVNLETLDLSNNNLPVSVIDSILASLDASGITNGTVELGGTNAKPTLGNDNTSLVSLRDDKNWGVTISDNGFDIGFTAAEGYVSGNTHSHTDWEGETTYAGAWQNDPTNGRITASSPWIMIRTSDSIRSQVGSTINVSVTFDFGDDDDELTADEVNPKAERTLLIALADKGAFSPGTSDSNVLDGTNMALMTKFIKKWNETYSRIRLYQKYNTNDGASVEIVDPSTSVPFQLLQSAASKTFTLTLQIQLGASKDTSAVTATMTNDDDGNSMTGSYDLSGYADMYNALVSSTSNVKLHFQAGEFADNSIEEINIYSATVRVN